MSAAADRQGARTGRHSAPPASVPPGQRAGAGRREKWAIWQAVVFSAAALVLLLAVRLQTGPTSVAVNVTLLALGALVLAAALACWSAVAAADRRASDAIAAAAAARQVAEAEAETKVAEAALRSEQMRQQLTETRFLLGQISKRQLVRISKLLERLFKLQDTDDTKLLAKLFPIDHLVIELRRLAEDGAVVTGHEPAANWSEPETARRLLRLAAQQIQRNRQIEFLRSDAELLIAGRAVPDLISVVAALYDNGTACSSPDSKVSVGVRWDEVAGQGTTLLIEIIDFGLGIADPEALRIYNGVLADPYGPQASELLMAGKTGLCLAGRRARRHKIAVWLEPNPVGGIRASVRLPGNLLIANAPAQDPSPADWDSRPAAVQFASALPVLAPRAGAAVQALSSAAQPLGDGHGHINGLPSLPTRPVVGSSPGFEPRQPPVSADNTFASPAAAVSFWSEPATRPDPSPEPETDQEWPT